MGRRDVQKSIDELEQRVKEMADVFAEMEFAVMMRTSMIALLIVLFI